MNEISAQTPKRLKILAILPTAAFVMVAVVGGAYHIAFAVNSRERIKTLEELVTQQSVDMHSMTTLNKHLQDFRFASEGRRALTGYSVISENNPLLDRKDLIRTMKRTSADVTALWARLTRETAASLPFATDKDKAVAAMLFVGAFFDYGNPPPDDLVGGCASDVTGGGSRPLTFAVHSSTNIGCCTDFALMLTSFLSYLGLKAQVLHGPSHQAVRVVIDGEWAYIDSNSLLFIPGYLKDGPKVIEAYTPFSGSRILEFQQFLEKAFMFDEPYYSVREWDAVQPRDHFAKMHADYLIEAL